MNNIFCYHLHKYDWIEIKIVADRVQIDMDQLSDFFHQSNVKMVQINGKKLIQVEYLLQAIENYFYLN